MPEIPPEVFVPIIVALISLGGGGSIVQWLKARKEAPVAQRAASIAEFQTVDEMRQALTDDIVEQYTRQKNENADMRKQLTDMQASLEDLTGRLSNIEQHTIQQDRTIRNLRDAINTWVAWGEDIVRRWGVLRLRDEPPDMPNVRIH